MKRSNVLICLGCLAWVAAPLLGQEVAGLSQPSGAAGSELGVSQYALTAQAKATRVELLTPSGDVLGTLVIDEGTEATRVRFSRHTGRAMELVWDPERGIFELEDPVSGSRVSFLFDLQSREWLAGEGADRLYREHVEDIDLVVAALLDLGRLGGEARNARLQLGGADPRPLAEPPAFLTRKTVLAPDSCTGTRHSAQATGVNATACCEEAYDKLAGWKCTNRYCWGCCQTSRCATNCGGGGGPCSCQVFGQACNAADVGLGDPGTPGGADPGGGSCTCDCDRNGLVSEPECRFGCGGRVDGQWCIID